MPYAPDYTGNLGVEFRAPLGATLDLVARVDASFVGDTSFHAVQDELVPNLFTGFGFGQGEFSNQQRDSYEVVNARIGLAGELSYSFR